MTDQETQEPTGPGAYLGDCWFGDLAGSIFPTHRWDGTKWERLTRIQAAAKRHALEVPSMEDHIFQWFNEKDPGEMQKCLEAYRAANLPDLTFDGEGEVE